MSVSSEDLAELLKSVEGEFLEAKAAEKKSVDSEFPLAKKTLNDLVSKINAKIALTERDLIERVEISHESPVISLVTAALEKKGYQLKVTGDKRHTQFVITW